jgi:hypothetical protein
LDSVNYRSCHINYASDQLRLDASLLFYITPKSRTSFFIGLGITGGISFDAATEIRYYSQDQIELRKPDDNHFSYDQVDFYETEYYHNKTNYGYSLYSTLGIDLKIGNKSTFWNRVHLLYEARPGITILSVPELGTISKPSLQHGFGIKISW